MPQENVAYNEPQRFEFYNGVPRMMAPARAEHVTVAANIFAEFRNYLKHKKCKPFADGVSYILRENKKTEFIPDVSILCDTTKIHKNGKIYGAPDLAVEVFSKSTGKRDRMEKLPEYAKAGTKEFWIVNPYLKNVEVYLLNGDSYILDNVYQYYDEELMEDYNDDPDPNKEIPPQEIKVSLYADLIIKLEDIFDLW